MTDTIIHNWDDTQCAECGTPTGEDADWMSPFHGLECSRRIAVAPMFMMRDDNTYDLAGAYHTEYFTTQAEAEARRDERAGHYKPHAAAKVRVFAITEVIR